MNGPARAVLNCSHLRNSGTHRPWGKARSPARTVQCARAGDGNMFFVSIRSREATRAPVPRRFAGRTPLCLWKFAGKDAGKLPFSAHRQGRGTKPQLPVLPNARKSSKRAARRGGRVVEGAPLLREYTGDGIEGSNPFLSAIPRLPSTNRYRRRSPRSSCAVLIAAVSPLPICPQNPRWQQSPPCRSSVKPVSLLGGGR